MSQLPIRVLVVDDHQTVLWGLQQLIDSRQPEMAVAGTASDPAEALRLAPQLKPDVILLDMDLGMSDANQLIPELLACCDAKILILTGVRDEARTDEAILRGARGILKKEVPAAIVLRAIASVHRGELWLDRIMIGRVLQQQQERERQQSGERARIAELTPKEREIARMVAVESGVSNKELAKLLFMSEHTLRNHLSAIYQKLGVGNRLQLYVYAVKHGLDRPAAY
ncbi:response regulator transcription factor [Massilia sp. LXY-6]|uniref:response regulator transcription factor n=1 Tax=Massilia sp. LXY-6 TaxID=3379823 RepID=UPI003EE38F05